MNKASWKREVSKLFNFLKFSPPGTRITSIDVILEILDRTLIDRWMKETRRLGGVGFQIHPHTVGKTDRLDYSLSRSLSCSRNEAESDWRAESRTNGRNFGGRRVTASYGGAKITGCLATRPFTIIDIRTYIHSYIRKRVPPCQVFWTKWHHESPFNYRLIPPTPRLIKCCPAFRNTVNPYFSPANLV